jgi:hypothetical protein
VVTAAISLESEAYAHGMALSFDQAIDLALGKSSLP